MKGPSDVRRECQVLKKRAARIRAESWALRNETSTPLEVVECLEAPEDQPRGVRWGLVLVSCLVTILLGLVALSLSGALPLVASGR